MVFAVGFVCGASATLLVALARPMRWLFQEMREIDQDIKQHQAELHERIRNGCRQRIGRK